MHDQLTALVLCGGRGSRMGGRDKGLALYRGRPLVEWALECVQRQADACLISANRHLPEYQRYGWPVLTDATPDFAGPLAGVAAGLEHCTTPWLLVLPCDTPYLPPDLGPRLLQGIRGGALAAYAADAERDHPVIHLLHRELLPELCRYREQGGAAVRGWLASVGAERVQFDDAAAFRNINCTADLDD